MTMVAFERARGYNFWVAHEVQCTDNRHRYRAKTDLSPAHHVHTTHLRSPPRLPMSLPLLSFIISPSSSMLWSIFMATLSLNKAVR